MTNYDTVKSSALARKTARLWVQKPYPKQGNAKQHVMPPTVTDTNN